MLKQKTHRCVDVYGSTSPTMIVLDNPSVTFRNATALVLRANMPTENIVGLSCRQGKRVFVWHGAHVGGPVAVVSVPYVAPMHTLAESPPLSPVTHWQTSGIVGPR